VNNILDNIKDFFRNLFQKENSQKLLVEKTDLLQKEPLFEKENRQIDLAKKLMNKEINIMELTDEEVEEIIEYFEKDNIELDREINKIKANIIRIKSKLSSSCN